MQHSDSEDSDIDPIVCEACGDGSYSVANPVLLCDGDDCDKGWHLECLQGRGKRLARRALDMDLDWFCDSCKDSQPYEFECICGKRERRTRSGVVVEYLIRWKGDGEPTWEPADNPDLQDEIQQFERDSSNNSRPH